MGSLLAACSALLRVGVKVDFYRLIHLHAHTILMRLSCLVAAFVRPAACRNHLHTAKGSRLPCRARRRCPTWALRLVRDFSPTTPSSRSSYLRHAPTLTQFKHLADSPGTEVITPRSRQSFPV